MFSNLLTHPQRTGAVVVVPIVVVAVPIVLVVVVLAGSV